MKIVADKAKKQTEADILKRQWPGLGRAGMLVLPFVFLFLGVAQTAKAGPPVELKLELTGDWAVKASLPASGNRSALTAEFTVEQAPLLTVQAEKYVNIPLYNPAAGGYARGMRLLGVRNAELTTPGLLVPESLVLRAGPEDTAAVYKPGEDYQAELFWGNFGRLPDGNLPVEQPVYASYQHGLLRLDSIVLTTAGVLEYRAGKPVAGSPVPPNLQAGEQRLANLWIPGRIERLTADHLFPILETEYPTPPATTPSMAEQRIPRTMAKLRSGEPLRILAWGDSVTESTYLPDRNKNCWQAVFVARLKERFPNANIELVTEAWGGRNTHSYLQVPPGQPHNYQETVLGAKPDLIVSEFVNDAGLSPAAVEERYSRFLNDFQGIGAEWIILTPHYVRPDWMGLTKERDVDEDPRPYVAGLREFSEKHNVALADAAKRYGRLWRQGIPYNTLMSNAINHPDARGMQIFADALLELFPEK